MIYLSSYRFGINADVLRHPARYGRAVIIMNALDVYGTTRLKNFDREVADLERLGYLSEELDLREYFEDRISLSGRLRDIDMVWTVGGNSFVLARAMNSSGFREALTPTLSRGLIYGGYSAGACVMGSDLYGIDLIDDPVVLPESYHEVMSEDTMGLVPFRIVPHVDSDHPESVDASRIVELLDRKGLAYRSLRDGEALVLDVPGTGGEIRP